MVEAMAKRAKIDPKAKQMFEGHQLVAGWTQSTSAAIAYLMLVLHQMGKITDIVPVGDVRKPVQVICLK